MDVAKTNKLPGLAYFKVVSEGDKIKAQIVPTSQQRKAALVLGLVSELPNATYSKIGQSGKAERSEDGGGNQELLSNPVEGMVEAIRNGDISIRVAGQPVTSITASYKPIVNIRSVGLRVDIRA